MAYPRFEFLDVLKVGQRNDRRPCITFDLDPRQIIFVFINILEVPGVDGGWGEWGSWSDCTASCGVGSKSRSRACTSPAQSGSGADCVGASTASEACEVAACPGKILLLL